MVSKFFNIFIGLFLSFVILESGLRIGEFVYASKKRPDYKFESDKTILFIGDSWTAGSDADPGASFYDLLRKDKDFKDFEFLNLAYGGNNCFQVMNSLLEYEKIPHIVIVNMGFNAWHLMGASRFVDLSREYLSEKEINELSRKLKVENKYKWVANLKLYKLFRYLTYREPLLGNIDLKMLSDALGSQIFFKLMTDFREIYPDQDAMYEALPYFLNQNQSLSLDQKFFFSAWQLGFDTEKMEHVLKKAGLFYPDKLKAFDYEIYKQLDIKKMGFQDMRGVSMEYSFMVLSRWSKKNNVKVFIQTYPDIEKRLITKDLFSNINKQIRFYTLKYDFKLIDHNIYSIDWKKYRTCWHVNNRGHLYMKNIIKKSICKSSIRF